MNRSHLTLEYSNRVKKLLPSSSSALRNFVPKSLRPFASSYSRQLKELNIVK